MAARRTRLIDEIAPEDLSAEPLRRLLDYWRARCRGDRLPARGDIDPLDLEFMLGHILLVDVVDTDGAPRRFRYRLVGTRLTERYGFDPTGEFVDQHPDPTFRRIALEAYGAIAAVPFAFAARRNTVMDNRIRRYETLILPLAADGFRVDMMMAGIRFMDPEMSPTMPNGYLKDSGQTGDAAPNRRAGPGCGPEQDR